MKKGLLRGIALGVMLTLVLSVSAQESIVKVNKYLNSDYSVVSVANPTQKSARLVIKDSEGEVVMKKSITRAAFSQEIIDLSNLNDGKYTAVLSNKNEELVEEQFALINNEVSDATIMSAEELKAFFRLNDNILYVSHIAFGANNFGISIEDAIGDQIFKKGFEGNSTYSGKFDISALPNGEYSVKIKSGKKHYSYVFKK
ncbi:DUF3244 domain-containing protein [Saccharicrinis aurantiacus]|uniref:DUF3244 domain-containing protein n=1 Tax=Saccharicrinis aurantiacus TaxID=1849719 RepID=UPI000837D4DE|nr:hypothetical protein [Saccharicrinis aurantiacus]